MQIIWSLTLVLLVNPSICFGKSFKTFVVQSSTGDEKPAVMKFSIEKPERDKVVWNNAGGYQCKFRIWGDKEKDGGTATLACKLPGLQEAQATFNCNSHPNEKMRGFFWAGKRGAGTNKNFYVWCE